VVSSGYIDRELDSRLNDISAFTAASREIENGKELALPVCTENSIGSAVKAVTGVVRHTSVNNGIVFVSRDTLY
jgi:hypothetical protein